MLLGTLKASLLSGKGLARAGEGTERAGQGVKKNTPKIQFDAISSINKY